MNCAFGGDPLMWPNFDHPPPALRHERLRAENGNELIYLYRVPKYSEWLN